MGEKVELKHRYKQLIRAGKQEEADRVLEKIWKLCGINKTISRGCDEKEKSEKEIFTKKYLESLTFTQLKLIGAKFGTTDRSKKNLIKEILNLQ